MFKTLFQMAANIYGYQGVHTPLESVTQGQYSLADYTSMRTELTARLIALENAGGFVPTNVTITGYLNVVPGGGGQGKIYTPSSIQCESILIQGGGAIIETDLQVGGSVVINNGLSVGGVITGDGSGISGITSADPTKLPLTGGTLTGELSIETDNGPSPTPSLKVKDTVGGQSINLEPSAGGGSYSALTQAGDALIHVEGGGGSNTGTLTLASWASIMSGVRITPTQVIIGNGGAGGLGGIPTASAVFSGSNITLQGTLLSKSIQIQAGSSISGDGSGLTGIVASDSTKLPLAGGTLTGALISRDIQIQAPYTITGNGSGLTGIVDNSKLPLAGGTLTGDLNSRNIQVQNGYGIYGDGSGLTGVFGTDNSKLPLIGGTMTGTLIAKDVQIQSGYVISGNGSGLTNVQGTDNTKLPLAGGTMTGTLNTRNINIQSGYLISGNGSQLTNVNDSTKLPLDGSVAMTGTLQAQNITLAAGAKYYGDGSALSGVLPLSGGTLTGTLNTRNINIQSGYLISGNGSQLTNVNDSTKLPLNGSVAMTGTLQAQNITVAAGAKYYGDGSALTGIVGSFTSASTYFTQTLNQDYTIPANDVNQYTFLLGGLSAGCTLRLTNLGVLNIASKYRRVTITKFQYSSGDYVVYLVAPSDGTYTYGFNSPAGAQNSSFTMPLGVYSVTFDIYLRNAPYAVLSLVSQV